jgi:hypothetical protein
VANLLVFGYSAYQVPVVTKLPSTVPTKHLHDYARDNGPQASNYWKLDVP